MSKPFFNHLLLKMSSQISKDSVLNFVKHLEDFIHGLNINFPIFCHLNLTYNFPSKENSSKLEVNFHLKSNKTFEITMQSSQWRFL